MHRLRPTLLCCVCLWLPAFCSQTPASDQKRIPWTGTQLNGTAEPALPFRATRVWPALELKAPVYLRAEPGTPRILVVDHKAGGMEPGGIVAFNSSVEAGAVQTVLTTDFLIYGFCFHPSYTENRWIYVISNGPAKDAVKRNRIARWTISRDDAGKAEPDSEIVILEWESNGHNGGDLAFGPDGMLYCPTGDGTTDSDPLATGQGLNDLLSVMLRLDVRSTTRERPYAIPPDNPFIGIPDARPEIWAYGFRNPWRLDIDQQSGQVWVGQNGQDLWEQVYLVQRGENYGWSVQEGSHPFYLERPRGPHAITPPTAEHSHAEARSLTGGIVCRNTEFPELEGCFLYGDYSTGRIWAIHRDNGQTAVQREIADTTLQIAGFARGHSGEILIADHGGGLWKLEHTPAEPPFAFPQKLSETGLFLSVRNHQMASGIMPYSVNVPFWSDGAHKQRWFAVPDMETIEYTRPRGWNFPNGSVLIKSFWLERRQGDPDSRFPIETRLMVRWQNEWAGYSYRWNNEATDAALVSRDGLDAEFTLTNAATGTTVSQTWHYPSRAECMVCHSRAANYVLGLCEPQMNCNLPDGNGGSVSQLQRLEQLGYFSKPIDTPPAERLKLVPHDDQTTPLAIRAASWLHANCSSCHVEAGGGNSQFSAEFTEVPEKRRLIDAQPVHSAFELKNARLVAPGAPASSILLHRISQRDRSRMPPIGSLIPDPSGVDLIRRWIEQLEPGSTASITSGTPADR
ncbi:MAG: PQQ-dependent sugar dehydrogenase [Planctomycetota bacterium]